MHKDYFPFGIAEGRSFFGRETETNRLLSNINNCKHTLLISTRRYGKSSLAKHAIGIAGLTYAEIDLFLVVSDQSIEYKIIKGVRSLIQTISDTPEQWFSKLRDFFGRMNKKWTIGIKGISLKLTPENHTDIADNILDALNALEYILQEKKQRAVLFIDEFQEITKSQIGKAIEGTFRHFAQESKHLSFIFSGSNRNILSSMFSDRARPLYGLCDRMNLGRIDQTCYKKYLNEVSQETLHKPIAEDVYATIIELTECHPHYVYVLCNYVWQNFPDQEPKVGDVIKCWQDYINELLKEIRAELYKLSPGQLKVLIAIGLGAHKELTGKKAQKQLNLTSGAIVYALRVLEDMDYIEELQDHVFRIVNPAIRSTLEMFYKDSVYE